MKSAYLFCTQKPIAVRTPSVPFFTGLTKDTAESVVSAEVEWSINALSLRNGFDAEVAYYGQQTLNAKKQQLQQQQQQKQQLGTNQKEKNQSPVLPKGSSDADIAASEAESARFIIACYEGNIAETKYLVGAHAATAAAQKPSAAPKQQQQQKQQVQTPKAAPQPPTHSIPKSSEAAIAVAEAEAARLLSAKVDGNIAETEYLLSLKKFESAIPVPTKLEKAPRAASTTPAPAKKADNKQPSLSKPTEQQQKQQPKKETSTAANTTNSTKQVGPGVAVLALKTLSGTMAAVDKDVLISQLEAQLADSKSQVTRLSAELENCKRIRALEAKVSALQGSTIVALQKQLDAAAASAASPSASPLASPSTAASISKIPVAQGRPVGRRDSSTGLTACLEAPKPVHAVLRTTPGSAASSKSTTSTASVKSQVQQQTKPLVDFSKGPVGDLVIRAEVAAGEMSVFSALAGSFPVSYTSNAPSVTASASTPKQPTKQQQPQQQHQPKSQTPPQPQQKQQEKQQQNQESLIASLEATEGLRQALKAVATCLEDSQLALAASSSRTTSTTSLPSDIKTLQQKFQAIQAVLQAGPVWTGPIINKGSVTPAADMIRSMSFGASKAAVTGDFSEGPNGRKSEHVENGLAYRGANWAV
jgi:molecular chaperone GrpE (heat shock protein)